MNRYGGCRLYCVTGGERSVVTALEVSRPWGIAPRFEDVELPLSLIVTARIGGHR